MYNPTPEEQTELDKFLKENLEKGYIQPSQSPMASPFFFVGKKDPGLRPCQDYRYLNEHTIKNAYPLPLISELLDKLKGAHWFTKGFIELHPAGTMSVVVCGELNMFLRHRVTQQAFTANFAQNLNGSAGGIIRHKSTRNESTYKYQ